MKLSIFAFFIFIFLTEGALQSCPRERCLPLNQCPSLSSAVRSRIPRLLKQVRNAICGYQGVHAKVCCDEQKEPENLVATASPLRRRVCHSDQHGNQRCRHSDRTGRQEAYSLLPEVCGRKIASGRIFSGAHAEIGATPWIVALKYTRLLDNTTHVLCSGTLINSRYVVTAAHCLDEHTTAGYKLSSLLLGEWRLSTNPDCTLTACAPPAIEAFAEHVELHPHYNKKYRFSDDIALIRLNQTVTFTMFIQPMCLPPFALSSTEVSLGSRAMALGWGQWEEGDTSDVLRKVLLNITTPLLCLEHFPGYYRINQGQLCLGGTGGGDTCGGDSGGPVIKLGSSGYYYLLALCSLGKKACGGEGIPAVYTSVAHYASWIRETLLP